MRNNILVITLENETDPSYKYVIDWLTYYKQNIVEITDSTPFRIKNVQIANESEIEFEIEVNKKPYLLSDFHSVWIRNGVLPNNYGNLKKEKDKLDITVEKFMQSELKTLYEYFFSAVEGKSRIESTNDDFANKLIQLENANKIGLKIPKTYISTDKNKLKEAVNNKSYITKAINEVFEYSESNKKYISRTNYIASNATDGKDSDIFPFLIQETIPKKYELSVNYLDNKFYSCALFSQDSEETSIDNRGSGKDKIRIVPFALPKHIEGQLSELLSIYKMKYASIDMIYSQQGEFIFLEINRNMYYKYISDICNYNLNKTIAEVLIRNEKA